MPALTEDLIIDFLSDVSFFSEVRPDSLARLVKCISQRTVRPGEQIFKKGDQGDSMFIIFDGHVRIHDDHHVYGTLSKNDCFGEYALIDQEVRSASVTASEPTTVFEIDRNNFLALMSSDSGFSKGLLAVLIKRHRELDATQRELATSKKDLELTSSRMQGLIDGAIDAIIMFDHKYRIVLTNPSADALLENNDTIHRNVLFFLDDDSASMVEAMISEKNSPKINKHLPKMIKVIGSKGREVLNEGTISEHGTEDEIFYTLILRNIEDKLVAENTISLLTKQTEYLEEEINELTSSYGIIAQDLGMKNVLNLIEQVARTDATVLITGETGTGKELVARAIHKASTRNDKPLIRVNCGAIPANLIESELFGHKKGAFTGATIDRKGRFLLADGGTIFLDEIGELPLDLQPKLLRVIQEGEFDPVGSSDTINVNIRIIAATHRDLLKRSQEHKFREDLYYRLNVFPITVPPLRARGKDIELIAREMMDQFCNKLNKARIKLSEADLARLTSYQWPGNVRELQNLVERAVIISDKGRVDWKTIIPFAEQAEDETPNKIPERILTSKELATLEKENIVKALKQTRWKISGQGGAAELLGMIPTTLASKIKSLGIERPV